MNILAILTQKELPLLYDSNVYKIYRLYIFSDVGFYFFSWIGDSTRGKPFLKVEIKTKNCP